jgi:AcrR family transcriptional regulator
MCDPPEREASVGHALSTVQACACDASHNPADRRRRKVRDAILAAAEFVLAREGAEGLSMRRLAEAVDYSPAALYKYFRCKDELLAALMEAFFERLVARMRAAAVGDSISPVTRLCEAFADYVETGLERPHHYAAAFAGVANADTSQERIRAIGSGLHPAALEAYGVLVSLVARGVEAGELRPCDPRAAAYSLWASMHGAVMLCLRFARFPHGGPGGDIGLSQREFIAMHARLTVRGLQTGDAP